MKKQIFSAAVALAAVAAMSVSAFAVDPGATNGSADGTVADGKVTLNNSVTVEGGFEDGVKIVVDVEPATDVAAAVVDAVEAKAGDVTFNTAIEITATSGDVAVQPDGSVTVTVAYDGKSNKVAYVSDSNEVELIDLTVNGNVASFNTTHFSTFYLVTVAENGNTTQPGGDDKNEPTGVVLAIVPAAVAAAAVVVSKKRK